MWTRLVIVFGLCTATRIAAQPSSEYCAVEVHVRNSSGAPVDTPLMIDSEAFERQVAKSVNGKARFCDVGLEKFSIVVGAPCGRVTVSGLSASPPSTRVINVIYDQCWSDEPPPGGSGCMVLLRVKTEQGSALSGASLWVNKKRYPESDRYGRMFLRIRYGESLEGAVKHDGYGDQNINIGCSTDEVRFERSVELTPTAP
jgi:hypothetical protein